MECYLNWEDSHTLPLRVVAANSLAAASAELDSSIAIVVVHASCYSFGQYRKLASGSNLSTYRLLELLQELMCLLLLCATCPRLHHIVRRQHRVESVGDAVGRHVGRVLRADGGGDERELLDEEAAAGARLGFAHGRVRAASKEKGEEEGQEAGGERGRQLGYRVDGEVRAAVA